MTDRKYDSNLILNKILNNDGTINVRQDSNAILNAAFSEEDSALKVNVIGFSGTGGSGYSGTSGYSGGIGASGYSGSTPFWAAGTGLESVVQVCAAAPNYAAGDNAIALGYASNAGFKAFTAISCVAGLITLDPKYGDVTAEFASSSVFTDEPLKMYIVSTVTYSGSPGTTQIQLGDTTCFTASYAVSVLNLNSQYADSINGAFAFANGVGTRALGIGSLALGTDSVAAGTSSISIGGYAMANNSTVISAGSHSFAEGTVILGGDDNTLGTSATGSAIIAATGFSGNDPYTLYANDINFAGKIYGDGSELLNMGGNSGYSGYSGINKISTVNTYTVSASGGDYATLEAAITAINAKPGTVGVKLVVDAGSYSITDTITVNSTRPLEIIGSGSFSSFLNAATGLTNKPMFHFVTPCHINGFTFDATTLASYGTLSTENAINVGSGYYEVTDFEMYGFNVGIDLISVTELFAYDGIFDNCAVGIRSNSTGYTNLDVELCNFDSCPICVHLYKGAASEFNILQNLFNNALTNVGVLYVPATYAYADSPVIMNNKWNTVGSFTSGFDYTRADGRDANVNVQNNNNTEDKKAHCKINVINNSSTTTITVGNSGYKGVYTNTNFYTCKWKVENNRITSLVNDKRDHSSWINGNVSVNQNNRNVDIFLIKNGNFTTRISPFTVRCATQNVLYTYAIVAYLEDVILGDYYEIWVTDPNNNDNIILSDITWFTSAM